MYNFWNHLDAPKCTGCGDRPQECWTTCGANRGYCGKCDSESGKKGACCMRDDLDDPQECKNVQSKSSKYTGYHTCVLEPGRLSIGLSTSYISGI